MCLEFNYGKFTEFDLTKLRVNVIKTALKLSAQQIQDFLTDLPNHIFNGTK